MYRGYQHFSLGNYPGQAEEYAVQMYDAFGKMGSNVKGGNANRPGLLQQCRSAHGPSFSAQYCEVFLKQGTVQYFVGICVPESCGEEDVEILVLSGSLQFGQTSLIPPLPHILVNQSTQEMIMTHCLSAIAPGLNLYGTMKTNGSYSSDINHDTEENSSSSTSITSQSFLYRCLQAFSIQNTSQGVLSTSSSIPGGGYSSLNGIRVLSLLWIICGHSAQFPVINNLDNYKNWRTTVESNPLHVLTISGPVFLAVDTFLLLGGLLSARSLLGSINKADDNLSPSLVANYLLRRIKRNRGVFIVVAGGLLLMTTVAGAVWQAALGWIFCLSVMAAVIGLSYILKETPASPSVPHALYQGLHRPLWALAVTWIILACEDGYGGLIKNLLSLGFWVPLSNISFACYLTHPVFIILYIGLQETPIHYTDINFMYLFFGHLVLTLVFSYVFTLLVEKPYLLLKWRGT
ncbi:O-acyltransferase like protein [Dissostichus eleginoides]|uniref:O-acyltransferase like protein n=1 Tax=Dissostichus eleginoides TaxID=100907 RepID=A0AAD9BM42_DISEL|nr:O-acyltransferase like protein [Dissostichus eleginoides]